MVTSFGGRGPATMSMNTVGHTPCAEHLQESSAQGVCPILFMDMVGGPPPATMWELPGKLGPTWWVFRYRGDSETAL